MKEQINTCLCHQKKIVNKGFLDTLEITSEIRQKDEPKKDHKQGTEVLELRRNSKAISKSINGQLCYLNSPIHKDYQNAYYCNDYLYQDGKKITGSYCKKRSCLICSRIYAARLFKAYSDPLLELDDLYMVTLTAPTVKAKELSSEIERRYKTITEIKDLLRKTYSIQLKGLRKLEITYNLQSKEFHPHYHLIVSTKEAAELIKTYWLKKIPKANAKAQDVRKVTGKKPLFELFKYVTKPIIKNTFNAKALDEMYISIKGIRTIQSFGIKQTQDVKIDKYESVIIDHKTERIDVWKWCNERKDWYTATDEQLNIGTVTKDTKESIKVIEKNGPKEYKEYKEVKHFNPRIEIRIRPKPTSQGSRKDFYFDD